MTRPRSVVALSGGVGGELVDASGEILGSPASDAEFDGVAELSQLLAGSPDVHRCFARLWYRWGYGFDESQELTCLLDQVATDFDDGDLAFVSLLHGLTASPHFTTRLPGLSEAPSDDPPPPVVDDRPDPPDRTPDEPTPDGVLEVVVSQQSVWDAGACDTVAVTNISELPVAWSVELVLDGALDQVWDAEAAAGDDGVTLFTGTWWNSELAPAQTVTFGFCTSLGGTGGDPVDPPPGPTVEASSDDPGLDVSAGVTSPWDSGYCAELTVVNGGEAPATWVVTLTFTGELTDWWGGVVAEVDGDTLISGEPWNAQLQPGASAVFGFCAAY